MVAQTLVVHLAKRRVVDGPALPAAMESALGASDAQGVWNWKDAYETVEAAQVARAMFVGAENSPARILAMLSKIGALLPHARNQTLRSKPRAAAVLDAA